MAATITYAYPVVGTVPPTAAQAFNANMLTANVTFLDADTAALITHNWNLSLAQGSNLWPVANVYASSLGTATVSLGLSLALTNSVAVTLSKAATSAGSGVGATFVVVLQRPNSIIT